MLKENPESILIIRLSAMGDVVMASPLIALLRNKYPDARLVWLAQPEVAPLLQANRELSEVIIWPKNAWRDLWQRRQYWQLAKAFWAFRKRLRRYRFDCALDMQGLLKSGIWAWMSGAKTRIGLGSKEGSAYLMTKVLQKPENSPVLGSEYRYLASQLALDLSRYRMHVALSQEDQRWAEDVLQAERLKTQICVICPFTTRPQKHWFETRWIALAQALLAKKDCSVVLLGGPGDLAAARSFLEKLPQLTSLVGKISLRQAAAMIARSHLLIGVDTGLTHMGIAAGIPTIALFGSTCPYLDTGNANAKVIYHAMTCSPCRRRPTCDGDFTCMKKISVEEVLALAHRLQQT